MADNKWQCLSDRLNYALELSGISKAEIARIIGVKPQTIQYLCSTNAESSKFTFELAHALGVNFEWLAVGMGDIGLKEIEASTNIGKPKNQVYTLDELQNLYKNNSNFFEMLRYPFEVVLSDHSMWPRFAKGTTLIFDRKSDFKSGDFVLVYLQEMDELVFRELIEQQMGKKLVPFNSNLFKEVSLNERDLILGILIEARWRVEQ